MNERVKDWLKRLLKKTKREDVFVGARSFFLHHEDKSFWGSITEEEEEAVVALVKKAASLPGPMIEIGALFGLTTQLIATHKPREKTLLAVENFSWNPFALPPTHHRILLQRVLRYATTHARTRVVEESNVAFYDAYEGEKPCFIFIDAEHDYENVKRDIDWAKKMKIPIISGHDYGTLYPGVKRAVEEAFPKAFEVRGSVWWHLST